MKNEALIAIIIIFLLEGIYKFIKFDVSFLDSFINFFVAVVVTCFAFIFFRGK